MDKKILGRTGLEVTAIGLGCGGFSKLGMFSKGIDNAAQIVRKAFENGVNFFDTASAYGTQPAVGKGLEGIARPSYIVSSKFLYSTPDGSIKPGGELEKCLDQCLEELHTDYIDIFCLHAVTPTAYASVRDTFYPELIRMKEKGKIRFAGITELFGKDTTHEALKQALADDLWDTIMLGYNILNPSAAKTLLPIAQAKNVGTICMFAVRNSLSNPAQLKLDVQKMLAENQVNDKLVKDEHVLDFLIEGGYAKTIPEAAYRFCRYTEGLDVTLTGTGNLEHLLDNLKSLSMEPLSDAALQKLEMMFGKVDCVSGQQEAPGVRR